MSERDDLVIANCYVALADSAFAILAQHSTNGDVAFQLNTETKIGRGYLIVQPSATVGRDDIGGYTFAPRVYVYSGEPHLKISLPPVSCVVLLGYDRQGHLMRWEDFRKRGAIGDRFMYATDTDDCAVEATCWPVFDEEARKLGQPREKGLPALVVTPGKAYVPQVLFWETRGYGKLHLRADNGGDGFTVSPSGPLVLELNIELARTAVDVLTKRFPADAQSVRDALDKATRLATPIERAGAADAVLVDALRLRDTLELAHARETIAKQGPRADFTFGVFEGSPYNQQSFQIARGAGFDLAPCFGWDGPTRTAAPWTNPRSNRPSASIATANGASNSKRTAWSGCRTMASCRSVRAPCRRPNCATPCCNRKALLDAYGDTFAVWEAMNEPNVTDVERAARHRRRFVASLPNWFPNAGN